MQSGPLMGWTEFERAHLLIGLMIHKAHMKFSAKINFLYLIILMKNNNLKKLKKSISNNTPHINKAHRLVL